MTCKIVFGLEFVTGRPKGSNISAPCTKHRNKWENIIESEEVECQHDGHCNRGSGAES